MEEDAKEILSPMFDKPQIQKQFDLLEKVVSEAQKRVDYAIAHDPDILKAIEIVERFLRKKRRVCYGGQAINAQLPKNLQFYDEKYSIPDYDFFSPSVLEDVDELVDVLEKAGFSEVNKKIGMHEGTVKIYVNYIPVADCSELHPSLFTVLQKRARSVNGILYCDPDFLRMLMYLELSRPRGEVARWKKVYERLFLLNRVFPMAKCDEPIRLDKTVSWTDRKTILTFCLRHKQVLMGPEFIENFEEGKNHIDLDTLVQKGGPVIFMSNQATVDAEDLRDILIEEEGKKGGVKVEPVYALTDQLFDCVMIKRKSQPLALIFQEDACHAYTLLKTDGGAEFRLGTPDLYLHLYFTLMIFGKKEKSYFQNSLECLVEKLFHLSSKSKEKPSDFVPGFGLRCSGHQKGIATLLKEKSERAKKVKAKNTTAKAGGGLVGGLAAGRLVGKKRKTLKKSKTN
jgi:hypothetical protein